MKLSPPASSSDLDVAREIARRLHHRRRRDDFAQGQRAEAFAPRVAAPAANAPAPSAVLPGTPAVARVTAAAPGPARPAPPAPIVPAPVEPAPLEAPSPEPTFPLDASFGAATDTSLPDELQPPSWDDAEPPEPAPLEGPAATVEDFEDLAPAPEPAALGEPAELPPVDMEEEPVSPDEMIGGAESLPLDEPAAEELPLPDTASPFDTAEEDEPLPEPEPFEDSPPPSWDEVAENCVALAYARAAILVDPGGRVFATRGDWPDPGPEAIAAKLVAMMDRTLRDTPTRSVSAPLGGQHLTAWRVPGPDGLLTVAFLADAPVTGDGRPAIDAEIRRGAGA
jgi:hypothetical protein